MLWLFFTSSLSPHEAGDSGFLFNGCGNGETEGRVICPKSGYLENDIVAFQLKDGHSSTGP